VTIALPPGSHRFSSVVNKCTKYCDAISGSRHVDTGVPQPQGSVLGPAMFILYLNDLLNKLHPSRTVAYADDVTTLCHGATLAKAAASAERTIALIADWSAQHGLVLSAQKSQAMFISPYCKTTVTSAPVTRQQHEYLSRGRSACAWSHRNVGPHVDITRLAHTEVRRRDSGAVVPFELGAQHKLPPSHSTIMRSSCLSSPTARLSGAG
jgi:hypothetical protein